MPTSNHKRVAQSRQGQAMVGATLLSVVAIVALSSFVMLGRSYVRSLLDGSTSASPKTIPLRELQAPNLSSTSVHNLPELRSTSASALQLLGGILRRLPDGATSVFSRVDDLPSPGSDLYRVAQHSLAEQLRTQGYAIVDLRATDAMLGRFRFSTPHQETNVARWFDQFTDLPEHGIRLRTGQRATRKEESALTTGTFHWHPDRRRFTGLFQIQAGGTQIAPASVRWEVSAFEELADLSQRVFAGLRNKTNLSSIEQKQALIARYWDELEAARPGLRATLDEGSVFTEPGELLVFTGRSSDPGGASPRPFGPLLHRRPAEHLNARRVLWTLRGDEIHMPWLEN